VWDIERHAAQAWPAAITERAGGWLLRNTPGVRRRRSNSALPPPPERRPHAALEAVEAFYVRRGLPVAIQVSPAEHHAELDGHLAARGYRHAAPTLVLTAPVGAVMTARHARTVNITEDPAPAWLDAFVELDGHDDSDRVGKQVFKRITGHTGYASMTVDGQIAGMGLFVAAPGWAGVFCMATRPAHRRQGIAASIIAAGARWAALHGADRLYLQVEAENDPAKRLYARAGFVHSHGYHYRIAPVPTNHPLQGDERDAGVRSRVGR
jgi:GNAT superfamily N-acetyltransferase